NMLNCAPNVLVSLPNILFIKRPIDINRSKNSLNFGLGFFSYVKAIVGFDKGALLPSLSYKGEVTDVGILPIAFRIYSLNSLNLPGVLSLGVNLKYMYRLVNSKEDLSLIEIGKFDFGGNFFDATAFGMDFGVIYYLNSKWHFGINATDLYNSQFKYKKSKICFGDEKKSNSIPDTYDPQEINPILNIGCAYIPEKLYYWPGNYIYTNDNITFAFDLTDLNNPNESFSLTPFKKIHIGTECRLNSFSLRAGLNSGYPSFGVGISLKAVNLEYAFYGEEKGILPGQDPDWMHSFLVSIKLRWATSLLK
ncbi:MAG: conjugal transfer protein TraF, partial [Endomicrobium sp.]|nr:conjugal transfer protein TraF [Endomicrobium sp.]